MSPHVAQCVERPVINLPVRSACKCARVPARMPARMPRVVHVLVCCLAGAWPGVARARAARKREMNVNARVCVRARTEGKHAHTAS